MKKINMKAIVAVMIVILTVVLCVAPVFAVKITNDIDITPSQVHNDKLTSTGNSILGYIKVIGTFIAVGVLMFLGIKYMTASANEKADIKKSIIPYIIGAIILLVAVNIVPIIANIGNELVK